MWDIAVDRPGKYEFPYLHEVGQSVALTTDSL
jgi:hypothetical protein